jgi:hypothetical protein
VVMKQLRKNWGGRIRHQSRTKNENVSVQLGLRGAKKKEYKH